MRDESADVRGMNTTPLIAAVLLAATGSASAQVELIDLLPGYTLGGMHGLSADGSTLAVDMFINDSVAYDAYAWRGGAWGSLPRYDRFNNWQGISGDGRTTLSVSSDWGQDGHLVRVENGVRDTVTFANGGRRIHGALTRDGQTVFYSLQPEIFASDQFVELYRYRADSFPGVLVATLSDRFVGGGGLVAGDRDDLFAIEAQIEQSALGVGGMTRAVIYDAGNLIELPTLTNADVVHFGVSAMTADGSVVVGTESSRGIDDFDAVYKSWIYRDGTLGELTVAGFSQLSILSITDDARAMVGSAMTDTGEYGSFLFYDAARAYSAEQLLAGSGVTLGAGEHASIGGISADGSTVYGAILRGTSSQFGPDWTLFTVAVPAPGGASAFALAGLLAARRRR
tara:strand:- start:8604 stop:9794 length:1191 start_codon:yes stop_codon:yes gene_type:complete